MQYLLRILTKKPNCDDLRPRYGLSTSWKPSESCIYWIGTCGDANLSAIACLFVSPFLCFSFLLCYPLSCEFRYLKTVISGSIERPMLLSNPK
ncbi:hypothetical protein V2G26_000622 [Clonostachys chloroleuca]